MLWPSRMLERLRELVILARSILKVLRLKTPGLVFLKVVSEEGTMLNFVFVLPPKSAADVVNRELVVSVDGAEPTTANYAGDATESGEFSGEQDQTVTGTLVDIDDAGNRSEPRPFEFVLVDNLAPAQPGELAIRVTSEV